MPVCVSTQTIPTAAAIISTEVNPSLPQLPSSNAILATAIDNDAVSGNHNQQSDEINSHHHRIHADIGGAQNGISAGAANNNYAAVEMVRVETVLLTLSFRSS